MSRAERTLIEIVQDPELREVLLEDCDRLLASEVRSKHGILGRAVRAAYFAVDRLEGGRLVIRVVDALLDEFAEAADPLVAEYRADVGPGRPPFGAWLAARSEHAAEALIGVTDRERERVKHPFLIRAYDSLRGPAVRLVSESVPALGEMLERYVDGDPSAVLASSRMRK